jgi:pyruvate/2-oxoglutarate dehydrogenase complex dihydrolipoamide acyltransferase (E2) component
MRQALLARRVAQAHAIAQASIEMYLDWDLVEGARRKVTNIDHIAASELIAWCAARAMHSAEKLRAHRGPDGAWVTTREARLGIAVALPGDDLATVRVVTPPDGALPQFIATLRDVVSGAASQPSQSDVSLVFSDMSMFGVATATPLVVPPSIATLFLGAPTRTATGRQARLVLAFDHTLINGAGAAAFLHSIIDQISDWPPAERVAGP